MFVNTSNLGKKTKEWSDCQFDPLISQFEKLASSDEYRDAFAIDVPSENKTLTYYELNERANQLAHYLLKHYSQVERICLFTPQSWQYVIFMLAVHKAGKAFLPVSPESDDPIARMQSYLKDTNVTLLITSGNYSTHDFLNSVECQSLAKIIYDDQEGEISLHTKTNPEHRIKPEDLAYIIHTSGSSGIPKNVLISHRGLPQCIAALTSALKTTAEDRVLAYSDSDFDASIADTWTAINTGATLVFMAPQNRKNDARLTEFVRNNNISVATFVASVLRKLSPNDFTKLRAIISTGEKIDDGIIDKWSSKLLLDGYGPSEYTIASWLRVINGIDTNMVYVEGLQFFIVKPYDDVAKDFKEVAEGEEGVLLIYGPGLALGYTNPELTKQRFIEITDPKNPNKKLIVYNTGDLVKKINDEIKIIGRYDRQLKIFGRLISPEEIDAAICAYNPNVIRQAHTTQSQNSHEIVAYIDLHDSAEIDLAALYESLKQKIPQLFIPGKWVIGEIPKLANGKVDKNKLFEREDTSRYIHTLKYETAKTDDEKFIAKIFQQILGKGVGEIYLEDDFFQLGGKSLQAMNLLQVLEGKFNIRLSYHELQNNSSIKKLAHIIKRQKDHSQPILMQNAEDKSAPTVFLIHPLLGSSSDYLKLLQHWKCKGLIYGFYSRVLQGKHDYDTEVYWIAYDYYQTIKQQPGLKVLIGWSFGGLLALTIQAIAASEHDDSIKVVMIDSASSEVIHKKTNEQWRHFLMSLYEKKLAGLLGIQDIFDVQEFFKKMTEGKNKFEMLADFFAVLKNKLNKDNYAYQKNLLLLNTVEVHIHAIITSNIRYDGTDADLIATPETAMLRAQNYGWPRSAKISLLLEVQGSNHESLMLEDKYVVNVAKSLDEFYLRIQGEYQAKTVARKLALSPVPFIDTEELKFYVSVKAHYNENESDSFDLETYVCKIFFKGEEKVLLVLANAGFGKTTFCQKLAKQLQQQWREGDVIPLYIPLGSYENPQNNLIERHLANLGFEDKEIQLLKKHQKFVIFIDGYDEADKNRYQNLYVTNRLNEWQAKVIIGCRSTYFINARDPRSIFTPVEGTRFKDQHLSVVYLTQFSESQIKIYITNFLQNPPEELKDYLWNDPQQYLDCIAKIHALEDFIKNPFLLRVLMEVLPGIYEDFNADNSTQRLVITPKMLLDAFVDNIFERAAAKLIVNGKLPSNGRDIRDVFMQFSIDLAIDMKARGITQIMYQPNADDYWDKYFSSSVELIATREGCPLRRFPILSDPQYKIRGNQHGLIARVELIGFMHELLINHFFMKGEELELERKQNSSSRILSKS